MIRYPITYRNIKDDGLELQHVKRVVRVTSYAVLLGYFPTNPAMAVDKIAQQQVVKYPKITAVIACTAATVWCARGVAERAISSHL